MIVRRSIRMCDCDNCNSIMTLYLLCVCVRTTIKALFWKMLSVINKGNYVELLTVALYGHAMNRE